MPTTPICWPPWNLAVTTNSSTRSCCSWTPNTSWQNPYRPAYAERAGTGDHPTPKPVEWITHDGGLVEIGYDGEGFSFDNEGPRHKVHLQPFALADRLVTAGEWLDFIADDGYRRPELWLSDGWAHINAEGWTARSTGIRSTVWHVFSLSGLQPVDPAEPVVHISYYEADAFARWSGARLPLESEWEVIADGQGPPTPTFGLHPASAAPESQPGQAAQLFGAVWQWTASPYTPYPTFSPAAGAVGSTTASSWWISRSCAGRRASPPTGTLVRPTATSSRQRRGGPSGLRLARDV